MRKNKLLLLLVLLMTAATGAWAQDTYKVSMKDGVKDADKWTISPNPAEEGDRDAAVHRTTEGEGRDGYKRREAG